MNSYAPVQIRPDRWAIEWFVNDVSQGLMAGSYDTELETLFMVYELARLEFNEHGHTECTDNKPPQRKWVR